MKPNLIREAVMCDDYSPGKCDYTTTYLLSPPQRTWLAVHNRKAEETRRERWPSFVGSCIHYRLEMEAKKHENVLAEERLYHTFEGVGLGEKKDITLGGMADLIWLDFKELDDYKSTVSSNPSVRDGKLSDPYKWQGHYNAFLSAKNGHPIDIINVHYLITDFRYGRSLVDPKHPKDFHKKFTFEPLPLKEIEEHIRNTIHEHEEAKLGNPRPCVEEEMWVRDECWVNKKPANKRARKKHYSPQAAQEDLREGEVTEHRKGERLFCKSYCGFAHACPQYINWERQS